jgi:hypothetical protein
MYGADFSMDGKRRILIVSFSDYTYCRFHLGKSAGRIQEAFLMVFGLKA